MVIQDEHAFEPINEFFTSSVLAPPSRDYDDVFTPSKKQVNTPFLHAGADRTLVALAKRGRAYPPCVKNITHLASDRALATQAKRGCGRLSGVKNRTHLDSTTAGPSAGLGSSRVAAAEAVGTMMGTSATE